MKKRSLALLAAALILFTAGCGSRSGAASSASAAASGSAGAASSAAQPMHVEELTVEVPRGGAGDAVRAAMRSLPAAMAQYGVEIGSVSLSFGSSYAATAQALSQGTVHLGFLPADALVQYGGDAVPLLGDAVSAPEPEGLTLADWNSGQALPESLGAGAFALVCAAPTEYGRSLTSRAESGGTLTWEELDRARWGVLDDGSVPGWQCLELWLEDHCQGNQISDLASVTRYDGWEELLRAAAAGEIDAFPLQSDLRGRYAELWSMEATRTDRAGAHGFGRGADIRSEVRVLAATERLCSWVAAAAPFSAAADPRFAAALNASLPGLFASGAEELSALGAQGYAPLASADLDGLRRLLAGGA